MIWSECVMAKWRYVWIILALCGVQQAKYHDASLSRTYQSVPCWRPCSFEMARHNGKWQIKSSFEHRVGGLHLKIASTNCNISWSVLIWWRWPKIKWLLFAATKWGVLWINVDRLNTRYTEIIYLEGHCKMRRHCWRVWMLTQPCIHDNYFSSTCMVACHSCSLSLHLAFQHPSWEYIRSSSVAEDGREKVWTVG